MVKIPTIALKVCVSPQHAPRLHAIWNGKCSDSPFNFEN